MKREKNYTSHGTGEFKLQDFKELGKNVVFEKGALVFHPENISIGNNVYIGHNTFLKAYHKNKLTIGSNVWIGQGCFLHSAGGITIEDSVGIGPMVKIITSTHEKKFSRKPIISNKLIFKKVILQEGCDIGIGAIILPGITIGRGSIIGAGAVVTKNIPPGSVAAGVPAKIIRKK